MERRVQPVSKNIALGSFHKEKPNDITNSIGLQLKQFLDQKYAANENLEIEAKIGKISPSKELSPEDPFNTILYSTHGLILPEQKFRDRNLYYFNPGVPKEKFDFLIEIFDKETKRREENIPKDLEGKEKEFYILEYCIKDMGEKNTIDRSFSDGVRKTFTPDGEELECLIKHRKKNINYLLPACKNNDYQKDYDFRISI
mmetsp:Transcript_1815/g.1601  ORF Transcript_1815/g.1601 Transcript_1815/m.1601 type:complete len:200 (+) Transcript_1815:17-616(+)